MNDILTQKQKDVLNAIKKYINQNGISPTFEELRSSLNIKSNNSLVQFFRVLVKRGYIDWNKEKRGIKIINREEDSFVDLPLAGKASCGQALCYTDSEVEKYIQVSSKFINGKKENYFIIQADGTSLNLAKPIINDKDFVLVRKMNQFEDNNIVVAIINGLATIKIFKRNKDGSILLIPKSTDSEHKPIILHPEDDVTICGKVEKVFNLKNNN